MSDPDRLSGLLGATGFDGVAVNALRAPMTFGADARQAYEFVLGQLGWLVADLDDNRREAALGALMETMRRHDSGDGVSFDSAMWLISARRV
jgi:hypothetical protein